MYMSIIRLHKFHIVHVNNLDLNNNIIAYQVQPSAHPAKIFQGLTTHSTCGAGANSLVF